MPYFFKNHFAITQQQKFYSKRNKDLDKTIHYNIPYILLSRES